MPVCNEFLIDILDDHWRAERLPSERISVPNLKLPDPEADPTDSNLSYNEQEQKWNDLALSTLCPELEMERKKQPALKEFSRNFDEPENLLFKFLSKITSANTPKAQNSFNLAFLISNVQQRNAKSILNTNGQDNISKVEKDGASSDFRNYKNTDLHRYWMPDEKAKLCYDCAKKFTSFRRKHHCRLCGQIFCSRCCNKIISGTIIMCSDDLKVCRYCSKTVLTFLRPGSVLPKTICYTKENDISGPNGNSFDKISLLRQAEKGITSITGYEEKPFISSDTSCLATEDRKTISKQSDYLQALYYEMALLMPNENRGVDLLRFLIMSGKSSNNNQATETVNALLGAGFLQPIGGNARNSKFQPALSYLLVNDSALNKNNKQYSCKDKISKETWHLWNQSKSQLMKPFVINTFNFKLNLERKKHLSILYSKHEHFFVRLLLKQEELDSSWASVLVTLCAQISNDFKPSTNQRFMDIRNCVSFKKVEGGSKHECCIKRGVMFTKNVAHKAMLNRIANPRVLLLQCPIIYERTERKYLSMETLLLQEKEYLHNVVVRILNLKPNIILVHCGVARIAQEMLHSFGMLLVLHVKSSVMEKLARCLQCDIVTSVDSNVKIPMLGTCDLFLTKSFADKRGKRKTLMGFEVNSSARNYVFMLRGGLTDELIRVKKIASLLLYSKYNWRFEMAFLLDSVANPQYKNSILGMKEFLSISNANTASITEAANDCVSFTSKDAKESLQFNMKTELKQKENEENAKKVKNISVLLFGDKFVPNTRNNYQYRPNDMKSKKSSTTGDIHLKLSDFRASYRSNTKYGTILQESSSFASTIHKTAAENYCFDMKSYQHIPILFCCFYCSPKAESSFCVEPTLFDMNFYTKNDIMLGLFLERYCFRSYICQSCNLSMTDHVRRYVHATGCIQVLLSANHSRIESDDILLSSWCTVCNESTSVVPLSQDTWCLSFGKYLELRFYDHFYKRSMAENCWNIFEIKEKGSKCEQHDFTHCFQKNGLAVKFSYTHIEVREINFPPSKIYFSEKKNELEKLIEIKNEISLRGHILYMKIHSRINENDIENNFEYRTTLLFFLNRDFTIFKQSIQSIESLLKNNSHKTCEIINSIENSKQMLQNNFHAWSLKLSSSKKHFLQAEDVKFLNEKSISNIIELENQSDDLWHAKTILCEEDKSFMKRLDQKESVSKIKLCSQSDVCLGEAHVLPIDTLPILITEEDFSSFIAYSLSSEEYRKYIDSIPNLQENPSDHLKTLKTQERFSNIDDLDDKRVDEEKKNKSETHIELNFQDTTSQISCKIYFAKEFDFLREKVYNASKSDDRFILKEMTKGDVTSFESFGPYYFDYITSCLSNNQATLLTKIFGIFKISVKKKESFQERTLLVMENLFFGLKIQDKFDLKGSERNRHVNTDNHDGEIVLLDENLIKMSWSKPLYIKPHSKSCLRKAINSDSTFLEQNAIIDYSLLVGLNKENGRLILGIIDYIRAFTFDKRLESLVKQSGLLGGQGKLPTVIAPQRYKQRFTEAMERYFLVSPDRCGWSFY